MEQMDAGSDRGLILHSDYIGREFGSVTLVKFHAPTQIQANVWRPASYRMKRLVWEISEGIEEEKWLFAKAAGRNQGTE